jgi:hypothetical protein
MKPTPKQASGYRGGFVGKVAAPLPLLAFILEASPEVFRRNPIKHVSSAICLFYHFRIIVIVSAIYFNQRIL